MTYYVTENITAKVVKVFSPFLDHRAGNSKSLSLTMNLVN